MGDGSYIDESGVVQEKIQVDDMDGYCDESKLFYRCCAVSHIHGKIEGVRWAEFPCESSGLESIAQYGSCAATLTGLNGPLKNATAGMEICSWWVEKVVPVAPRHLELLLIKLLTPYSNRCTIKNTLCKMQESKQLLIQDQPTTTG